MVQIPTYFRGKLESEQTGINTPDTSGQKISQSVGGLADTFFQGIMRLEAERKTILNKVEIDNAVSGFQSNYIKGSQAIKDDASLTPEQAEQQLNSLSDTLKDQALSGVEGSTLKEAMRGSLSLASNRTLVENSMWRVDRENTNAFNTTYSQVQDSILTLRSTVNTADYQKVVADINKRKDTLLPLMGHDAKKVDTFINNATKQATMEFAYNLINEGKATQAMADLLDGKFNDAGLDEKALTTLSTAITTGMKGEELRATLSSAAQVLSENSDMVKSLDVDKGSLSEIQNKRLNVAFEIDSGNLNPEMKKYKQSQLKVLNAMHDMKLSGQILVAQDDVATVNDLYSDGNALINQDDPSIDDMIGFQDKVSEAFSNGEVSFKTYSKLMGSMSKTIAGDFVAKTLKKAGPFGMLGISGEGVSDNNKPAFRELFKQIEKDANYTPSWLRESYDIYTDMQEESETPFKGN